MNEAHTNDDGCALPHEIVLCEYGTPQGVALDAVYAESADYETYLTRSRWLVRTFVGGTATIKARQYVGFMPYRCKHDKDHLL